MFTQKRTHLIGLLVLIALALFVVACSGTTAGLPGASVSEAESAASAAVAPAAQTGVPAVPGSITVVGQGKAFGTPDQAQAQIGVDIFAETVDEAANQNQATFDQLMAALTDLGIAQEDIQTSNYSVWAEQRYNENGIPEGIAGYRVTNQVNVTIRDISKVSDVLAAAIDAGANSIYGVSFSVADPAALEAEARAAAMADAEQRAASLAELGNVELGGISIISEVIGSPVQPLLRDMGAGGAAELASAPGISPGQLSFQVQVQVTYALQ
jgi:uncharacterized protein YggE